MNNKPIYFEGLNGIRAIAVIGVLFSHITLDLELFGLNPFVLGQTADGKPKGWLLAGFGVSMFFALSGFLITYLLLREKETGRINIKKFYLRRIFRIWPIYYLYLAICLVMYVATGFFTITNSVFFYIFYAANAPLIIGTSLPLLGHYWSLGVEEQFYLFWPWITKLSQKWLVWITLGLIVFLFGLKVFLHIFFPNSILEVIIHVTRFHCMLVGALFAILYYQSNSLFLRITTHKFSQAIVWLIMVVIVANKFHLFSIVDNEIVAVVTAVMIMGQITQNGLISLENNVFDFLGKISYGIYVIHPLIIFGLGFIIRKLTMPQTMKYLLVYALIPLLVILLAHWSYKYFEKPFLRYKNRRFSVVKSANSKSGHA